MDPSTIPLNRYTERTVLRCAVCERRVGAVHETRVGPILVTLEYASEEERAEYALDRDGGVPGDHVADDEFPEKLPPVEYLRWLDGSPLTPTPLPVDAACPNHGALVLDLERITAAYDARHRGVLLEPRPSAT